MLNLATQNYCNSRHNRHTEKHHFRHQFQANRPAAQKRLMIAAMAVAAGAAFADTTPITSANIVGFAPAPAMESEGEAVGGVLFMVPQFKNIAGAEYSIQDIVLDPENASPYEDNIQLISLEGDGDVIESYIWLFCKIGHEYSGVRHGVAA